MLTSTVPSKQLMYLIPNSPDYICVCLLTIDVEENMQEVVGHITEGVCRPLKVNKQIRLRCYLRKKMTSSVGCTPYSVMFSLCTHSVCYWSVPQVRIEQVIVAEPGAVLLYKLSNLLKFYHHTIRYLKSLCNRRKVLIINQSFIVCWAKNSFVFFS